MKKRESIGQRHAGPGANADVQGKLSFSVSLEGLYQRMDSSYLGTGDEVWASTPLRTQVGGRREHFGISGLRSMPALLLGSTSAEHLGIRAGMEDCSHILGKYT